MVTPPCCVQIKTLRSYRKKTIHGHLSIKSVHFLDPKLHYNHQFYKDVCVYTVCSKPLVSWGLSILMISSTNTLKLLLTMSSCYAQIFQHFATPQYVVKQDSLMKKKTNTMNHVNPPHVVLLRCFSTGVGFIKHGIPEK